tara:strand:+ start:855 stop:1259 length:405 start_codon:yes stop_codon:yes gene_type:complete
MGIFFLRVSLGLSMFLGHGLGKLQRFEAIYTRFPDPIGLGSPFSLLLVVFAEAFCSMLVVLGLGTRLALIPLIITMGVACFIFHMDDPFSGKEKSFLYLIGFISLFLSGSGKWTVQNRFLSSTKNRYLNWLLER